VSRDVEVLVIEVPRAEIAYVKFIFESYEGVAVTRTLDRRRALLVLLVAPDFLDTARSILAALADEVGCRVVPRPASLVDVLDDGPGPME
jgi:hypothetical protein